MRKNGALGERSARKIFAGVHGISEVIKYDSDRDWFQLLMFNE